MRALAALIGRWHDGWPAVRALIGRPIVDLVGGGPSAWPPAASAQPTTRHRCNYRSNYATARLPEAPDELY